MNNYLFWYKSVITFSIGVIMGCIVGLCMKGNWSGVPGWCVALLWTTVLRIEVGHRDSHIDDFPEK